MKGIIIKNNCELLSELFIHRPKGRPNIKWFTTGITVPPKDSIPELGNSNLIIMFFWGLSIVCQHMWKFYWQCSTPKCSVMIPELNSV